MLNESCACGYIWKRNGGAELEVRKRNWTVILACSAGVGYFLLGIVGMFLLPVAAMIFLLLKGQGGLRKGMPDEDARLAAFVNLPPKTVGEMAAVPDAAAQDTGPLAVAPAITAEVAASRAIAMALRAQDLLLAVALFQAMHTVRPRIVLDTAQWIALGEASQLQGAFIEAAWSLHAAAVQQGNAALAQKRLLEAAGKAHEAGALVVALRIYRSFLAKYPESSYASFARARMEEINAKTPVTSSVGDVAG